jgi:hypothetical protein
MSKDLTKKMLNSRKVRMTSGSGEAWFYISPSGLEVCVASAPNQPADNSFTISKHQMRTALAAIDEWSNGVQP